MHVRGRHDKTDVVQYSEKFLRTFNTVAERVGGVENPMGLGFDDILTVNKILFHTYAKMWDLNVDVIKQHEVPKHIMDEFWNICDRTWDDLPDGGPGPNDLDIVGAKRA